MVLVITLLPLVFVAALLIGAATASVARVVTREHGPFDVFVKLRQYMKDRYAAEDGSLGHEVYAALNCPICLSWYIAGAFSVVVAFALGLSVLWLLIMIPAAVGVAYALLGMSALWQ